jgi:hypothetical protein
MISPGSLPIHGIFSPTNKRRPIRIIKTPRRMSILPKAPNPNIRSHSIEVLNTNSSPQSRRGRGETDFLFGGERPPNKKASVTLG